MKITAFTASPRKEGNTAWVINTILEGAKEQGGEVQSWYSCDLDIGPCLGCFGCRKGNKGCNINDDMQKLYGALETADALILGSPVYMGQMSAQAKIFTDRLFAPKQFSPRFSPHFKETNSVKKKMALVFTQGNPDAGLFREYFDYTKKMFQMLNFDIKDVVVVAGTREGSAREQKGLHDSMKGFGSRLVSQ
ncbi:MAG: flavodoxin family protein [Treponema sp.]|jgi:multimeric flavodoxin WrbA|nr:flavodoxin family protein [Treponema sp.]